MFSLFVCTCDHRLSAVSLQYISILILPPSHLLSVLDISLSSLHCVSTSFHFVSTHDSHPTSLIVVRMTALYMDTKDGRASLLRSFFLTKIYIFLNHDMVLFFRPFSRLCVRFVFHYLLLLLSCVGSVVINITIRNTSLVVIIPHSTTVANVWIL